MWWLLTDELGRLHLEAVGHLAEGGHARLYLVALDALGIIAAELEKLRMLREYELGVRVKDSEGSLYVAPVEKE